VISLDGERGEIEGVVVLQKCELGKVRLRGFRTEFLCEDACEGISDG
jgi:hypothetical protein